MSAREVSANKNKKRKNKKKYTFFELIKKIIFWFIFFGFSVATIWTVIFSPVMEVREVEIIGAAEDEAGVRNVFEKNVYGEYFNFIPKDNLITVPLKKIQAEIFNNFFMIRKIEVERKFPAKVVFEIERRKKTIIWSNGNSYWFVDERAEAFHHVNKEEIEKLENDILVTDGSGREVERGDEIAHIEIVDLCSNLQRTVQEEGDIEINNKSLYIPSPVSGEVRVKTKEGWEIYFSSERPLARQVKILKKVLAAKITQEDLVKLEYVDLRVKGKVVYRFTDYKEREKELEEIEVKGASSDKAQEIKTETEKDENKKKNDKKK